MYSQFQHTSTLQCSPLSPPSPPGQSLSSLCVWQGHTVQSLAVCLPPGEGHLQPLCVVGGGEGCPGNHPTTGWPRQEHCTVKTYKYNVQLLYMHNYKELRGYDYLTCILSVFYVRSPSYVSCLSGLSFCLSFVLLIYM